MWQKYCFFEYDLSLVDCIESAEIPIHWNDIDFYHKSNHVFQLSTTFADLIDHHEVR